MTTSEIISHLGFGVEMSQKLLISAPNYIHMLRHFDQGSYAPDSFIKKQSIRVQC